MSVLSDILRDVLIPWAQQGAGKQFVVAAPDMSTAKLPVGVQLTQSEINSRRVVIKNRRNYSNVRNVTAEWPDEGLQELNKYALICVLSGNINYQLWNYRLRCGPGTFIFVPPGTPYPNGSRTYVDLERGTHCELVSFLLHPNAMELWISRGHPGGRDISNYSLLQHEPVRALLQALMTEVVMDEEGSPQVGEALLYAFLSVLQRQVEAGRLQSTRLPQGQNMLEGAAAEARPADFAGQLGHYVQSNLHKQITIDIAARDMYLSRAQFVRRVRQETGLTFNQLIAESRLREAKSLLTNSGWNIGMIARMVGFRSATYFGIFFKQHVGVTPGEFREDSEQCGAQVKNEQIRRSMSQYRDEQGGSSPYTPPNG